jgi:hypothetical protein
VEVGGVRACRSIILAEPRAAGFAGIAAFRLLLLQEAGFSTSRFSTIENSRVPVAVPNLWVPDQKCYNVPTILNPRAAISPNVWARNMTSAFGLSGPPTTARYFNTRKCRSRSQQGSPA